MTVTVTIHFSHEEQHEIPYQIIGETVSSSRWNTVSRGRKYDAYFSAEEKKNIAEYQIASHSKRWYICRGFPKDGYTMSTEEYALWLKLAKFCSEL